MDQHNPLIRPEEARSSEGEEAGDPDLSFLTELDDLLDNVFVEGQSADTPIHEPAINTDDFKDELQSIFRLAVKDHLRPVATYSSYILQGNCDRDSVTGLLSVLPPVIEASGEVGMDDFSAILSRMYALVLPLKDQEDPQPNDELLRELGLSLSTLPAILELGAGDSLHRQMTIDPEFEQLTRILHGIQSLNQEMVHCLFRAGLTTPKALLDNRISDIMDVTGLNEAVVTEIVNAVRESPIGQELVAKRKEWRRHISVKQLKELEVRLTKALRIREKISAKLAQQRKLILSIQRENSKLEGYFLGLTEKLKTLQLAEDEIHLEPGTAQGNTDPELQQLRIRIRSIRQQIEAITRQNGEEKVRQNALMGKITRLQKRYKRFVAAEEDMIADLDLNREQLAYLRRSITAVKKDLIIRRQRQK